MIKTNNTSTHLSVWLDTHEWFEQTPPTVKHRWSKQTTPALTSQSDLTCMSDLSKHHQHPHCLMQSLSCISSDLTHTGNQTHRILMQSLSSMFTNLVTRHTRATWNTSCTCILSCTLSDLTRTVTPVTKHILCSHNLVSCVSYLIRMGLQPNTSYFGHNNVVCVSYLIRMGLQPNTPITYTTVAPPVS